ncbi:MAG: hypothetical protein Q4E37_04835 [Tissierellia bacterium]|nr:hypothetical protein [Tissierellia bacterium]
MNQKNRNKGFALVLLLLLVAVSIGGIYGYWAGEIADPEDVNRSQEITIGEGQSVETELEVTEDLVSEGMKLVPIGKAALSVGGEAANVEAYKGTFTVYWKETEDTDIISSEDQVTRTLSVRGTPSITGATAYNDLVNVTIKPQSTDITADGDPVTVEAIVTLEEPADKAAYDAIVNNPITVGLSFSVQ